MSMDNLLNGKDIISNETKLICFCARSNMDKYVRRQVAKLCAVPLDWESIIKNSIFNGVAPLIYYNLNKINLDNAVIPQKSILKLKNCYYRTLLDNLRFWKEFQNILSAANSAGIRVIPIKGIILAHFLYYNIGQRSMYDIDLLIQENDLAGFEKIILRLGYKRDFKNRPEIYWKKYYHHLAFIKENDAYSPLSVEAHWNLTVPRAHKILFPRLWQRIQEETIGGDKISVLSSEDTLLCLVLHLRRHAHALILRQICDISELLKKCENSLDWGYIIEEAEKNKMKSVLYFAVFSAKQILDAPLRVNILDKIKPNSFRCRRIDKIVGKWGKNNGKVLFNPGHFFLSLLLFDKISDFFFLYFIFSFRRRCALLFNFFSFSK